MIERPEFLDWVMIKWHQEQTSFFPSSRCIRVLCSTLILNDFDFAKPLLMPKPAFSLSWVDLRLTQQPGNSWNGSRHCIGENTFLMRGQKGVMCYIINRLIANLNTGTTWEAFMPVLDWARQLSVPIRPFVLQQCIRVMIFTTFLMLMLSSILRPI